MIEPAVFAALEAEVRTLDMAGVIGRAGEEIDKAPAMAEHKRHEIRRKLERVEARLEQLVDCITPGNKDIITEKMVALRKERGALQAELENTAALDGQAASSARMVGRLVELAGQFRELWSVATLAEKTEFLAFLIETISIYPERKTAEIRLTSKYSELKKISAGENADSFLSDCRGEWIRTTDTQTPSLLLKHGKTLNFNVINPLTWNDVSRLFGIFRLFSIQCGHKVDTPPSMPAAGARA